MLRRSLFTALGGFDEALPACEDYDLWLRVSCRYPVFLLDEPLIIKRGGQLGVNEIVIGMPHRGRLNVLANVMGKPYTAIFSEFQGGAATDDVLDPYFVVRAVGTAIFALAQVLFLVAVLRSSEEVAVPALDVDVAFIHVNRADAQGNGQALGRDPYFDNLFCMAADKAFMSCEKIVPTGELVSGGPLQSLAINRMMVNGVVEAPGGASFTECPPDYSRNEALQREYAKTAKDEEAWKAFKAKYLDVSEADYQRAVSS